MKSDTCAKGVEMKKLMLGVVGLLVALSALAFFLMKDIAPRHPALLAAELPELIPTHAFYADLRSEFGYIPSGDGRFVAFKQATLLGLRYAVRDLSSAKDVATFPSDLVSLRWHPSKPLLRFVYNGDDWEVDPFRSAEKNWKKISPKSINFAWQKISRPKDDDARVLVWGKPQETSPQGLYLVSQDGLEVEEIATGTEETSYWVLDQDFNLRLRSDYINERTLRFHEKTENAWERLFDVDLRDTFHPLTFVGQNNTFFARSSRGRDKVALVKVDAKTGGEQVIYENENFDVGLNVSLSQNPATDILRTGDATSEYKALTDRGQVLLDILDDFSQPVSIGSVIPSTSGRFVTAAVSPNEQSYIYLLIDMQNREYEILGEFHFRRFKEALVASRAVAITARDGLEIPAILARPKNVDGPIPFVVRIHGGPASHFSIGYEHEVQFLANRGYGVLSVNFRGSTGFGKKFEEAGFRQFGRAMQDDIADAARWLVSEGLADLDALIAMGISYGGYSAALAMTRDPDLFDAAIVEFPVLDVEFQSKNYPEFWENGLDHWQRYFGDPKNEADLALMREFSPSNLVDQLHGPILLIGGELDPVTDVAQAKSFEAAAREQGKSVEAHYFANAGHGATHWRDKFKRARLIEDFLAEHAGGRSGGLDWVELVPSFIQ